MGPLRKVLNFQSLAKVADIFHTLSTILPTLIYIQLDNIDSDYRVILELYSRKRKQLIITITLFSDCCYVRYTFFFNYVI